MAQLPNFKPVSDIQCRDMLSKRVLQAGSDDPILYTITADATLRIFMPVLDAPQYLQLHSALDIFSSLPFSVASRQASSTVFWLDREIMTAALKSILTNPTPPDEDARQRRVREISEEGWDIFLRVLANGSLVVQAVAVRHATRARLYAPCVLTQEIEY